LKPKKKKNVYRIKPIALRITTANISIVCISLVVGRICVNFQIQSHEWNTRTQQKAAEDGEYFHMFNSMYISCWFMEMYVLLEASCATTGPCICTNVPRNLGTWSRNPQCKECTGYLNSC